ncbi:MAG TPA: PKD domain-containing protein [Methanolinea sp.]|nr:PKD domain-containing protein [Methanolinea sp.]HQJ18203.1 PKD domain-containing protein [Methanolinea sp.]
MSTVKPILWKYSFGDGFMATQQNATHTYRKPGTYNVTLTVWTMGPDKIPVTHKVEKTGYITVT